MAKKESIYIATNKLYGSDNGVVKAARELRLATSEGLVPVFRSYLGGVLSWDVWKTILSANDFNVPSSAVTTKDYMSVESKGTDYDNEAHPMSYDHEPKTIDRNPNTISRQILVSITQEDTDENISVWATQAAKTIVKTEYKNTKVLTYSVNTIPASGGTATLNVHWQQQKVITYSSGEVDDSVYVEGDSVATITNGSGITNTYISSGKVVVPSAGYTTYIGNRTAYTISSYSFVANGVTTNIASSIAILQAQNSVSYTYLSPTLIASYTDVGANGSAAKLTLTYQQVRVNRYTSNADPTNTNLTGNIPMTAVSGHYITSISGNNASNNASLVTTSGSASRGNVTAKDLTTNQTARTIVLKVSITASVNGVLGSIQVDVYQAANVRTITSTDYYLTATPQTTTPNAAKQGVSIDVSSTYVENYSYTSGSSNNSGHIGINCTASTDRGTLSNTTIANGGETTLSIAANTSTSSTVAYNVTFNNKGKTTKVAITQQKDAVASSGTVSARTPNTPNVGIATAAGDDAEVAMTAVVQRKTVYVSGNITYSNTTENVTITSMTNGSTTISVNVVAASNLGTTPSEKKVIATISKIVGSVAGGSVTWTGTLYVYQEANTDSKTKTGDWQVTCSGDTSNVAATGISSSSPWKVTVNAYHIDEYTWTSGSKDSRYVYGSGTITKLNVASVSATSFTGKSGGVVINVTIDENPTKDTRICTITATSNGISKSVNRTQNASAFALSATPPLVGHEGGNATLQIVSTRNSKAFKPSVSVSGISGASVVSITLATDVSTTGLYYCVISFPANSSTSSRTLTASISQTGGNSATTSITQSGVPVTILGIGYYAGGFAFYKNPLNGAVNYNRITVSGKWSSEGPEWTGGTLVDARAVVSNTNTGTGTVISSLPLGSITLPQDGLADFGDNGTGLRGSDQAKYVLLYWGSPSQLNQVVEIPPAEMDSQT